MNSSQYVILAIAPGRRELGVAVFADADLIYSSVKTIRHRKSNDFPLEETTRILETLCRAFSIKTVVVKTISQYQKLSPGLERVAECIEVQSARKGLEVRKITLEEIKRVLCASQNATEKKAFEMLLASYPELRRYWNRPNKWQRDYYAFLFSAVAVGMVYLKTFSERD